MTTRLLGMQSFDGSRYGDSQLDLKLASEISNLYSPQDDWICPPRRSQPSMTTTPYTDFPIPNLPSSEGQFRHDSMFQHNRYPAQDDGPSHSQASQRAYTDFVSTPESNGTTAPLDFTPQNVFSASTMFAATNLTTENQNETTMTPLVTRFNAGDVSPGPSSGFSFDGQPRSAESHNFMYLPTDQDQPALKRRRKSLQTSREAHSPTESLSSAGRRRRSEYAEPGSARAIYLEKNRKAASKCRNKQKRQQDDLVETAREVERRNRFLKAEVELLRAGMRELMEVVGKHNECPDTRLRSYVQREANRLAGSQWTTVFSPPSKGSSSDGMSPNKSSSP